MLVVSDSYFLAGGHITLKATPKQHTIKGLSIHGNTFRPAAGRGGPTIDIDERDAMFTSVLDMSVTGWAPHLRSAGISFFPHRRLLAPTSV